MITLIRTTTLTSLKKKKERVTLSIKFLHRLQDVILRIFKIVQGYLTIGGVCPAFCADRKEFNLTE
jgi:hypothetical protein